MIRQHGFAAHGKIETSDVNEDDLLATYCNNLHYVYQDVFSDLKKMGSLNRKNQQISKLLAKRLSKLTD